MPKNSLHDRVTMVIRIYINGLQEASSWYSEVAVILYNCTHSGSTHEMSKHGLNTDECQLLLWDLFSSFDSLAPARVDRDSNLSVEADYFSYKILVQHNLKNYESSLTPSRLEKYLVSIIMTIGHIIQRLSDRFKVSRTIMRPPRHNLSILE